MPSIKIQTLSGVEAKSFVDPFYEKFNGRTRAVDSDVFFVAWVEDQVVGTIRFCLEENVQLLRGMLVDDQHRHQGIGVALLEAFRGYLVQKQIDDVYCLPQLPLEHFYERIGFQRVERPDMPEFLVLRMKGYQAAGTDCVCMRRRTAK